VRPCLKKRKQREGRRRKKLKTGKVSIIPFINYLKTVRRKQCVAQGYIYMWLN
jgi:hypothetical protein